jgi:hypothetical protein
LAREAELRERADHGRNQVGILEAERDSYVSSPPFLSHSPLLFLTTMQRAQMREAFENRKEMFLEVQRMKEITSELELRINDLENERFSSSLAPSLSLLTA